MAFAAREPCAYRIDGIAGVRHERDVARLDVAEGYVANALFRADKRQGFAVGVNRDAEPALIPVGDGLPEFGQAVRLRVAVVGRVKRGLAQPLNDAVGRGDVRVAYAETDYLYPLLSLGGYLAANLNKEIRRHSVYSAGEVHIHSILEIRGLSTRLTIANLLAIHYVTLC